MELSSGHLRSDVLIASTANDLLVGTVSLVGATFLTGVAASVVHLVRKRADTITHASEDNRTIAAFLFDTPGDSRTHTPARKGWTTRVDEKFDEHSEALQRILAEVVPDGNGGHNLRGIAEKAAKDASKAVTAAERAVTAAEKEASEQVKERERVAEREKKADA